jgi:dTDP-4-dehydrorhamnose 3,5-epimerase
MLIRQLRGGKFKMNDQLPELEVVKEVTDPYTAYKISKTRISGLFLFERKLYEDERGFYQELGRLEAIEEAVNKKFEIKQWALSYNLPGVLRGLHAEPQDKLITPITGQIFIAIADIRPDSPTFGKYVSFTFDQTNPMKPKKTLIVAEGLANSFLVLGDRPVEYLYAVTDTYQTSEGKKAIRWDDPDLAIKWPETPKIISDADRNDHKTLREMFPEKFT